MAEKLVPLYKDGRLLDLAVTPADFRSAKLARKDGSPEGSTRPADFETYAEAGYRLGDRYEDGSEYDGPKTKAQFERAAEERKAARAEAQKADAAARPAAEDKPAPRAEAKKD